MSGRKNVLPTYPIFVAGDMSQPSLTSLVTEIKYLDNVGIQLQWSGSPVGSFQIQVSADHNENAVGKGVTVAGQWTPLPISYFNGSSMTTVTSLPTSAGSPFYIDLTQLSAPYIRVVYTSVSGSGTLSGFITSKMI